jgi:hypothetical protein
MGMGSDRMEALSRIEAVVTEYSERDDHQASLLPPGGRLRL